MSNIITYGSSDGFINISILSALALILLSIKSAIADSKEYPKDLIDSINAGANGILSLLNIKFSPVYFLFINNYSSLY